MNGPTRITLVEFDDHSGAAPDGDEAAVEAPEFVLPENLEALSAEFDDEGNLSGGELSDLHEEAVAAFDAVRAGSLDNEALQVLSDLTTAIEAIREDAGRRVHEAAEAAAAADEFASRVHPPEAAPEAAEAAEAAEGAPDEALSVEAAAEGVEVPVPPAEEAPAEPEVLAAAASRPGRIRLPFAAIRANTPDDVVPVASGVTITAAADLPGRSPGSRFEDLNGVARAMHARARHLSNGSSAPIATIDIPMDHVVTERMSAEEQMEVVTAATNPNSLVAAGGWCAPSEILWDQFSIEGTDGLWDAPEIGVNRGGLEFLENGGLSIADIIGTDAVWLWTEQNDIDAAENDGSETDVTKPCVNVPCPEWDEVRLDMHGLCVSHGNLADRAYPEGTRRFLDLVLAAHVHTLNGRRLAAVQADSDPVTMGASDFGASATILGAIELQVEDYKDKYRMPEGAVLELVGPRWARALVRSDLAKRQGVDMLSITNAQIDAHFAVRGARVQWVYDWQALQTGPNVVGTADGFREAYPTTVGFLLYAAGTWLNGRGPSIELGVTRDSAQIAVNDHTAAFTEDAWLTAKRGHESRFVSIPVAPTGLTGGGLVDTVTATY